MHVFLYTVSPETSWVGTPPMVLIDVELAVGRVGSGTPTRTAEIAMIGVNRIIAPTAKEGHLFGS
tara:strand:+ start:14886 stop:15080 length:195 start_codon:yes stop_codon:yes gene_type:complete